MPNFSSRPRRAETAGGLVAAGIFTAFGLLWTIMAFVVTADAPFPAVHVVFPLFGVLFICCGIAAGFSVIANAPPPSNYGPMDVTHTPAGPGVGVGPIADPNGSRPPRTDVCFTCGEAVRPGSQFCPRCGHAIAANVSST